MHDPGLHGRFLERQLDQQESPVALALKVQSMENGDAISCPLQTCQDPCRLPPLVEIKFLVPPIFETKFARIIVAPFWLVLRKILVVPFQFLDND